MVLWAFRDHDSDDHRAFRSAFLAHVFYFHVDKPVVLIVLADFVEVLFQLDFIKAACFIHEINERSAFSFHLFAQFPLADVRISLEADLAHRSFGAFVHCEHDARRATLSHRSDQYEIGR